MNLSSQLASMELRVRLFDLDPQAGATRWARLDVAQNLRFAVTTLRLGSNQNALMEALRAASRLDIAVVDTPPERSPDISMCLRYANVALIPVAASPLDLWGAQEALRQVHEVQQERDRARPLAIFVPSRLVTGSLLARTLPLTLAKIGEHISPPIHQRVAVAEAAIAGKTAREYEPRSKAAQEFDRVAKYVLDMLRSCAESKQ